MNASPTIRPAVVGDAGACAGIKNAWIDITDWMPRIHEDKDVVEFYREHVIPNRRVFVCGDPVAGYIALDDESFVTSLFVANPGNGIGKLLLDFAKSISDRLRLWTFVANTGARRFYEKEGFTETERSTGDNEENLPDILFEWEKAA